MTVTSVPDAVRILTRRSIEPTTSYNDNAVVGTGIHGFAIPDTIDDLDSGALHYTWSHAINTVDTPMVGTPFSHPCNLAVFILELDGILVDPLDHAHAHVPVPAGAIANRDEWFCAALGCVRYEHVLLCEDSVVLFFNDFLTRQRYPYRSVG